MRADLRRAGAAIRSRRGRPGARGRLSRRRRRHVRPRRHRLRAEPTSTASPPPNTPPPRNAPGASIIGWRLRIQRGEPLPADEPDDGVAVEARLLAEDPDAGFAVTPGRLALLSFPVGTGVRIDANRRVGDTVERRRSADRGVHRVGSRSGGRARTGPAGARADCGRDRRWCHQPHVRCSSVLDHDDFVRGRRRRRVARADDRRPIAARTRPGRVARRRCRGLRDRPRRMPRRRSTRRPNVVARSSRRGRRRHRARLSWA